MEVLEQGSAFLAARVQNDPDPDGDLYRLVGVALVVNLAGSLDEAKLSGEMVFERLPFRFGHTLRIMDRSKISKAI
ncbi:MAG: hypothetical protein H0W54_02560 [Rubrobacter sp.]|nr:hypothetical protein [Rubrobacter sp.]